jgi:hypothetical protein
LGASVEQLEITGNLDGVLAREDKYLAASKGLHFQNKQEYDQDVEAVCWEGMKKDDES